MQRFYHIFLYLSIALLAACQHDIVQNQQINDELAQQNAYLPGKTVVKVSEQLSQSIESGDNLLEIFPGAQVSRSFTHKKWVVSSSSKNSLYV